MSWTALGVRPGKHGMLLPLCLTLARLHLGSWDQFWAFTPKKGWEETRQRCKGGKSGSWDQDQAAGESEDWPWLAMRRGNQGLNTLEVQLQ